MKLPTKAKKALGTLRKELGLTPADNHTLPGGILTLDMIKNFENDTSDENNFLISFYIELFSLIVYRRIQLEVQDELSDYEPNIDIPVGAASSTFSARVNAPEFWDNLSYRL